MKYKSIKISKDGLTLKDIDMGKREAVIAHATYDSPDREGDVSQRGMFTKSWNSGRNDIRLFKNHDKGSGPGRVVDFMEDDKHAYTKAYLGTHTEGEDVLKQLDEGIIVAASFGFLPLKDRQIKNKHNGYDLKEVKWLETSVLTHWGAHQESGIVSVVKSWQNINLKEMSDDEKNYMRRLIANRTEALNMSVDMMNRMGEDSDMYSVINEMIGSQSYDVAYLKRCMMMEMKELEDIRMGIKAMEKFIRNTTASDECIQKVESELLNTKQLLSEIELAVTSAPEQSTQTPTARKLGSEFQKELHYLNLKLKAS
ncbi:MAG TPA: HK97 family phage prohead protease [Cyclobacteriaceae bacterium]|nr:HK97 family phage prohead protease [Cyclobacteriaceae bacterium]